MAYLLDTVTISEVMTKVPNARVVRWLDETPERAQFISVLSMGEIQKGIFRLTNSHRKDELQEWFESVQARYSGRLLPFELETAGVWGNLMVELEKRGRPIPIIDSLIAATALEHGLTLITRNVKDFEAAKVDVLNIWE